MSRPLRIEYPDAWYHVMNRGRSGDDIFPGNKECELFVALLKETCALWDVKVSAYCLMDNHYHLLLQTPNGNLSRFMRHLNGVYTQRYNRLHGYDGSVFRGRFKSILVEEDSYLLELVRYIHRNPLRAGIVQVLEEYPWSSHPGYLTGAKKWDWLYKDFILSLLTEKRNKRQQYRKFMLTEEPEEITAIFAKKKLPPFLGSETFLSWVKETFFTRKHDRQIPQSVHLAPTRQQIVDEICRVYEVEEQHLFRARRGQKNEARNVAIYLCRVLRNDTLRVIGQAFGMTGYSPAGSAVERVKKELSKDRELRKKVEGIKKSLLTIKGTR